MPWLAFAVALVLEHTAPVAPPPNLLVLMPDQWRGSALGFLGEEPVITPHLDRLAERSLVLTSAASNYPVCSPFRAMFLTGRYPHANGVLGNCNSQGTAFGYELGKDSRCWSDVLADQGYELAYLGKWHLEAPRRPFVESGNNSDTFAWNEWTPPERRHGFRHWYAYNTYDHHLAPEYWAADTPRNGRVKVDQWGPEHEADQAIAYLRNEGGRLRARERPFALVVAMNPPHMPYNKVPDRYRETYAGKTAEDLLGARPSLEAAGTRWGDYTRKHLVDQYAMMTGVDEQVGRILAVLEELDLTRNTLVVFVSDHGDCLGLHGQISKNNHYEESLRIPLVVSWPGVVPARQDDLLVSVPDLYPTLLSLMGLAEQVPEEVQGTDHSAVMRGEGGPRPTSQLYLWMAHERPELGRRGVRTARYTLRIDRGEDGAETVVLHDRLQDPFQMVNLAEQQPEVVRTLVEQELAPWLQRTGDPWQ